MKKIILSLTITSSMLFVACDDAKEDKEAEEKPKEEAPAPEVMDVSFDLESSYIAWKSWDINEPEEHAHNGKVRLQAGSITIKGDEILSGGIVVDIFSLFDADIEGEKLGYLVGHLSSPDFFSVDSTGGNAPTFLFSSYENGIITGDLTIAGETASVEVPATLTNGEDGVTITSETFEIDMMPFNMPYFAQEKDMDAEEHVTILNPSVEFSIHLVGK